MTSDELTTLHYSRIVRADLTAIRANLRGDGTALFSPERHSGVVASLEALIAEAGGEEEYVAARVRQAKADVAGLIAQSVGLDKKLQSIQLPPTGGNLEAEDDVLRMIDIKEPGEVHIDETRLAERAREWANGPHERGHAMEHPPGRDAVIGEVIELKAKSHCRGPRTKRKEDLIQTLWTHYLKKAPKYVPRNGSIEVFAAVVTNRRIQEFVRKDVKERKAAPVPLTHEPAAADPKMDDAFDLEIIRATLDQLPEADRAIVTASLNHDSDSAAAKSLGMKRQTFVDRVRRIVGQLSSKLLP